MNEDLAKDGKQRVLFVAEDTTSLTVLRPIAEAMIDQVSIEAVFLLCDSLWENSGREVNINKSSIPYECYDIDQFLKRDSMFNRLPVNIFESIAQRAILDSELQHLWYDTKGVMTEIDPDMIVTANDSIPFLRHLIREGYKNNVVTATIQHGIYSGGLDPANWEGNVLFPSVPIKSSLLEYMKRRLGFRYGITTYCNPYSDLVLTLGDFFTEHIKKLREGYPCFGNTTVISTGSPEYSGDVANFSPQISSVLFLSQQKLETGEWDCKSQNQAIKVLNKIDKKYPVTIRAHPKDSQEKIEQMAKHFPISETDSLSEDISNHDCVLTVNSTAIYEGIIQGKVCGILDIQCSNTTFAPLSHHHLLSITDGTTDLEKAAQNLSTESQRSYLRKFCKMPEDDKECSAVSSTDLIVRNLITKM